MEMVVSMDQVAVTGIGVINAMGVGRDAFWEGCLAARSGIREITSFETHEFRSNVGGCVAGFKPVQFMPPMVYRRMSGISRMMVAAATEALTDSRLQLSSMDRERVAVVIGTSYGGSSHVDAFFLSLLNEGPRGAQPMLFPETVPNAPASHIAMLHKISGPNITFCQNEISAETAMSYAANLLSSDIVDTAIVGGGEELSEILYRCYNAVGALNRVKVRPGAPVNPAPAGGLVLGEGAATLILEKVAFAQKRGARIYGTLDSIVVKGGEAAMGHYETQGTQMAGAMRHALKEAGIRTGDVDHISISANYSRELDVMECEQLCRLFDKDGHRIDVTPLKYLTGDFGAAGATRAAAVLLSLYHQKTLPCLPAGALLPGTAHLPGKWVSGMDRDIRHALMTSTTFGGGTCSMVFSRYPQ
jgi:3-oxoacyl-[acyl-carrier-protein] synthase II